MPRRRAPKPVAQERNSENYLAYVQHLLDTDVFAWSSAPDEQEDRLFSLIELISQISNRASPGNRDAFSEYLNSENVPFSQLSSWLDGYLNSDTATRQWSEESGYASLDDAIQAMLVTLARLLEIVRRV